MNATEDNTGFESTAPPINLGLSGRLSRLKINRFRNVESGTEIRFDGGINVLLGRNGTGKTTLLDLVSAISRGALGADEQEEFDLGYDLDFGDLCLSLHVQNTASKEETSGLGLDRSGQNLSWSYRVPSSKTLYRDAMLLPMQQPSRLVSSASARSSPSIASKPGSTRTPA